MTPQMIDLKKLCDPFKEEDVEWRLAQCGKKGNGQVWAMCLAYIQARAIMNRLDSVCGPENWRATYRFASATDAGAPGVICSLSVKYNNEWVTKEDGAEQTDIESFKGGLSSALKRAGSVWGIGRYLYQLESGFATIVPQGTKDAKWGKTKDGADFYWIPPALPAWALPPGEKVNQTLPKIVPEQPAYDPSFDNSETSYRITFGKYAKRSLEEVGPHDLAGYVRYLEDTAAKKNTPIQGQVKDFVERATAYIMASGPGAMN